jgi:CRP-like cAMP-binding protein
MSIQLNQLGIPDDEVRQFQSFIRLYSNGKLILQEGDASDPSIFLLRVGTVEVTKRVGDRQEVLSRIDAVNFFGEIAVVANRPRTATVTAVSDPVVVYAFDNPNLPAMLANPKWGTLLIRRLAESLDHMNIQYEHMQLQIGRMNKKIEQTQAQADQLASKYEQTLLLNERLRVIIGDVLGLFQKLHLAAGKDESLRQQFFEAIPKLIALRAKDLKVEPALPESYDLSDYYQRGALPDPLFQAAIKGPMSKP